LKPPENNVIEISSETLILLSFANFFHVSGSNRGNKQVTTILSMHLFIVKVLEPVFIGLIFDND